MPSPSLPPAPRGRLRATVCKGELSHYFLFWRHHFSPTDADDAVVVLLPGNPASVQALVAFVTLFLLTSASSTPFSGLTAGLDALQFRATRSGRQFSPWEDITSQTFDIAAAIAHSRELNANLTEDLAELDSGPPVLAFASLSLVSTHSGESSALPSTSHTRDKARSKAKRAMVRAAGKSKVNALLDAHPRHPHHISRSPKPIKASFDLRKIRVAATGWIGLRDKGVAAEETAAGEEDSGPEPTHSLPDFFGPTAKFSGFRLAPYLGPSSRPIVDAAKKVCAVFGGMPDDPDFMAKVHDPAVKLMEEAQAKMSVTKDRKSHRRGNFLQLTGGASHGGGQVQPGDLVNGVINAAIFLSLCNSAPFIRLAGFATGLFANWAPDLFDFYVDYMRIFYKRYTHLRRPFLNGIFAACTFNLGPRTCARGHHDFANFALGWCAITAFGSYDYRKGGHLILWDCKLILEFPPGCTILIPSAAIFHSNIPISPQERRYSFTQYTAGGIFRWVEHGFRTEEEYFESLTAAEQQEEKELGLQRATEGADMFSTIDELRAM